MANASTWAEVKAALQSGNNVTLTADIDMNEVNPLGDNIIMNYGSTCTLDGNGHTIKNLRTKVSSPVAIFGMAFGGTGRTFTIKNLDFQNLILAGASLIGANGGTAASTTVIENVRICGTRSGEAYMFSYNGGITMSRCSIDLPWKGSGDNLAYTSLKPKQTGASPSITDYANYCRFVESYGGWNIPNVNYDATDSAFLGCSYFKLNGCRIEGSMKMPYSSGYSYFILNILNFYVARYTPSAQNVCDIDWILPTNDNYEVQYSNFSGVVKKSFTKPNGTSVTSVYDWSTSGYPIPIFATEEQMKDAAWLSNAGFDIIVPIT